MTKKATKLAIHPLHDPRVQQDRIDKLTSRIRSLERDVNTRVREHDAQQQRADDLAKALAQTSYAASDLRMALEPFTKSKLCRVLLPELVGVAKTALNLTENESSGNDTCTCDKR